MGRLAIRGWATFFIQIIGNSIRIVGSIYWVVNRFISLEHQAFLTTSSL